jgi:hypothetical protein
MDPAITAGFGRAAFSCSGVVSLDDAVGMASRWTSSIR